MNKSKGKVPTPQKWGGYFFALCKILNLMTLSARTGADEAVSQSETYEVNKALSPLIRLAHFALHISPSAKYLISQPSADSFPPEGGSLFPKSGAASSPVPAQSYPFCPSYGLDEITRILFQLPGQFHSG